MSGFAGGAHPLEFEHVADAVRDAAYRIIAGKGHTSFGIATAIVRICEAIVRDERAVLPVSALLTGEMGISGLCLSLPCIIGAQGIERIVALDLPADEYAALHASAAALRSAMVHVPPAALRQCIPQP